MAEPRSATPQYAAVLNAAIDIISARLLALIAVCGAVGMFSWSVADPMPWRSYTVTAYAIVVLWPLVWQMARKE